MTTGVYHGRARAGVADSSATRPHRSSEESPCRTLTSSSSGPGLAGPDGRHHRSPSPGRRVHARGQGPREHPLGTRRDRRRRDPGRTRRPREGIGQLAAEPDHPYAFLGDGRRRGPRLAPGAPRGRRPAVRRRPRHAAPARADRHRRDAARRDRARPAQAAAAPAVGAGRGPRRRRRRGLQGLLARGDRRQPRAGARLDGRQTGRRACAGVSVELPGLADRHNLNALELARRFDDPARRADGDRGRWHGAIDAVPGSGGRVALPAVSRAPGPRSRPGGRCSGGLPLRAVRDAARPAQRARDAPLRGTPRRAPPAPAGASRSARWSSGSSVEGGRVTAVEIGGRRPHVHGSDRRAGPRHRRDRRRRAGRRARRPARRAAPRTPRGGPARRRVARRRRARPGRPPARGGRDPHRCRAAAAGRGRTRPRSPTSAWPAACSPASGRPGALRRRRGNQPAAGGQRRR